MSLSPQTRRQGLTRRHGQTVTPARLRGARLWGGERPLSCGSWVRCCHSAAQFPHLSNGILHPRPFARLSAWVGQTAPAACPQGATSRGTVCVLAKTEVVQGPPQPGDTSAPKSPVHSHIAPGQLEEASAGPCDTWQNDNLRSQGTRPASHRTFSSASQDHAVEEPSGPAPQGPAACRARLSSSRKEATPAFYHLSSVQSDLKLTYLGSHHSLSEGSFSLSLLVNYNYT